jgi:prepilin-type processing-associated H-X9-DG protein
MAVIGLLASLLLPAVQAARESSRRAECSNNLKQFGLALANYEGVYRRFPGCGASPSQYSIHTYLLPYFEHENVQELVDPDQPLFFFSGTSTLNPAQAPAARTAIKSFLCPSDSQPSHCANYNAATFAGSNYMANGGTGEGTFYDTRFPTDGMFWNNSEVRVADVLDGTSHTLFMAEALRGNCFTTTGPVPADVRRQAGSLATVARTIPNQPGTNPLLSDALCATAQSWLGSHAIAWIWGQTPQTFFNTHHLPNAPVPDCTSNGQGWFKSSSLHPGGVNALYGDGSVRWVRGSVSLRIWRAMSTRAGSEVVSAE